MTNSNPFLIAEQNHVVIEHPDSTKWVFNIQKDGFLQAYFLQFDENLDVLINLMDENAKCQINCAYLVNKNNNLKIDITVIHKLKNTHSNQQIKGLVTGNSQVDFTGTIEIPYNSQKCNGQQNHRAVLLSPKAIVSSTPQLEIWADDVQCAHGSAIGPLDQNQLFYLQTRGLGMKQARQILLQSFLGDLMPQELNAIIQEWMDENV